MIFYHFSGYKYYPQLLRVRCGDTNIKFDEEDDSNVRIVMIRAEHANYCELFRKPTLINKDLFLISANQDYLLCLLQETRSKSSVKSAEIQRNLYSRMDQIAENSTVRLYDCMTEQLQM